ncbi:uncharacterized protein LOC144118517 [Amblyomma americanum]
MRWLAASALLFLIAVQLAPLAESGPDKCKVYKKVKNVQWEKMARKEWLEALHSRSRHPECLSRAYFPQRGRLERRKKRGPHKTVEKSYHPFTVHKGDIFLYRDETQFEQLISTDHRDWALIYHCWPKGSGAHFVLLITRKGGVVTGDMLQKARAALRRAGYHEKITWKRSGCLCRRKKSGRQGRKKKYRKIELSQSEPGIEKTDEGSDVVEESLSIRIKVEYVMLPPVIEGSI